MKNLIRHIYIAIMLYRLGYWFSKLTNDHESWGFYRLNFTRPDGLDTKYAIFDIDFGREYEKHHFSHIHNDANGTIHRYDML